MGEAEPEDLSGSLNRFWYERNTGRRVADVQRRVKHSAIPWMAATLDGIVEGTEAVFEAKFMLPWSFSEEAATEKDMAEVHHQHVGRPFADLGAVNHYRRRQMGRGRHSDGPALSHRSSVGGKKFWRCVQSGEVRTSSWPSCQGRASRPSASST
jgi:hypothetical protein